MKNTKVVFASVRSGNNKNNNKENAHLLTTAILSGLGREKIQTYASLPQYPAALCDDDS